MIAPVSLESQLAFRTAPADDQRGTQRYGTGCWGRQVRERERPNWQALKDEESLIRTERLFELPSDHLLNLPLYQLISLFRVKYGKDLQKPAFARVDGLVIRGFLPVEFGPAHQVFESCRLDITLWE